MLDRIDLLTGTDFQQFCSVLLSSDDPMFAAVDGSGGDMGNDGFLLVGDTLYQAYGPTKREAAKVRNKIDTSVAQAVAMGANTLLVRRLILLTPFDLTHEQHMYLQAAARGGGLAGEPWGGSRLASILARHPEIRRLFPQFLLPDVAGDLQVIRAAVEAGPSRPKTLDDVFGEDFEPNLNVLQWNEDDPARDLQAYESFRVRVYSPAFRRGPFEPYEEDDFRDAVRGAFAEDRTAGLEPTGPERVLVGHRHPRLHRRWGWWTTMSKPGGAVGMAATLRDVWREGVYSVADVAADLVRFLTLAGSLAGPGKARVVFGMDPGGLRPELDPSDRIARERLSVHLAGVQSIAVPVALRPRENHAQAQCDLQDLPKYAVRLAAECVVWALRTFHNARVATDPLEDSILPLMDALNRARSM